jgi:hypothetical protein
MEISLGMILSRFELTTTFAPLPPRGRHPITADPECDTQLHCPQRPRLGSLDQRRLEPQRPRKSWAETSLEGIADGTAQIQFDDGQDVPGPVSLAVAAENLENQARLAVYGDSDFAMDVNFPAYANGDLIVNTVDWAVGQEDLISLTPKNQTPRMLVPPQQTILNLIFLGTVIILPGLALLGGVIVFMKRRRRG